MRFYAERPGRLARQILSDVLVLAWVALCVQVARASYNVVLQLQDPGLGLVRAGNQMVRPSTRRPRPPAGYP